VLGAQNKLAKKQKSGDAQYGMQSSAGVCLSVSLSDCACVHTRVCVRVCVGWNQIDDTGTMCTHACLHTLASLFSLSFFFPFLCWPNPNLKVAHPQSGTPHEYSVGYLRVRLDAVF